MQLLLLLLLSLLPGSCSHSASRRQAAETQEGRQSLEAAEAVQRQRNVGRLMRASQGKEQRPAALAVGPKGEVHEVKAKVKVEAKEGPADGRSKSLPSSLNPPQAAGDLDLEMPWHTHADSAGNVSALDLERVPAPPETARVVEKKRSRSDNIHGVTVAAFALTGNIRSLAPGSLLLVESLVFAREEMAQERARRCPSIPSRLNFTALSAWVQMTQGILVTLNLKLETGESVPNVKVEWTEEPQPQSMAALSHMRAEMSAKRRQTPSQSQSQASRHYSVQLEKYAKLILPKDVCDFQPHSPSKASLATEGTPEPPPPPPRPVGQGLGQNPPSRGVGLGPGRPDGDVSSEKQKQQTRQEQQQEFLLSPPLGVEVEAELAAYKRGLQSSRASLGDGAQTTAVFPASFSWREKSPKCLDYVHHQGSCGSCYMFAAIDSLSDRHCIDQHSKSSLGEVDHLSIQMGLLCEPRGRQCAGGWADVGFNYAMQTGINTERRWPYERSCLSNSVCQFGSQCMVPYTHECADFFSPAQLEKVETYADALVQAQSKCRAPEVQQSAACGDWAGKTFGNEVDEVFSPSRDWCSKVLAEFRAFLHPSPGPSPNPSNPGPGPAAGTGPAAAGAGPPPVRSPPPCSPKPPQAAPPSPPPPPPPSASPSPSPSPSPPQLPLGPGPDAAAPSPSRSPGPGPGPQAAPTPAPSQNENENENENQSVGGSSNGTQCRAFLSEVMRRGPPFPLDEGDRVWATTQTAAALQAALGRCQGLVRQPACERWLRLAFASLPSSPSDPFLALASEDFCTGLRSELAAFSELGEGGLAPDPAPAPDPDPDPDAAAAQASAPAPAPPAPAPASDPDLNDDGARARAGVQALTFSANTPRPRPSLGSGPKPSMLVEEELGQLGEETAGAAQSKWIWQWWTRRRRTSQTAGGSDQSNGGSDGGGSGGGGSGRASSSTQTTTTTSAWTIAQLCDRNRCKVEATPHTLKNYHYIDNVPDAFKKELYNDGPFYTSFYVYEDFTWFFRSYPTHGYNRQWGRSLGGHAVVLVGWEAACTYHDGTSLLEREVEETSAAGGALAARAERHRQHSSAARRRTATGSCWHLRNSWGGAWGDKGYFRMKVEMLTGPDGTHIHIASAAADGAKSVTGS